MSRRKPPEKDNYDRVLDMLENMPRIRPSFDGTYTYADQVRDFVKVFSTEEGKRVISQIQQICDPAPRVEDADKPGTLAFKAGQRRVFTELMLCFVERKKAEVVETYQPKKV